MKRPKILRLRLLAHLWPSKRRRGVAIITVLAIVSLMTILIISFFQMAQTAKTTAVNSVEMERVVTLKDVITNYVTAQIRTATTLQGTGGRQTIWTSQPGAIRTFGSTGVDNRLYKLYSDDEMLIDNIEKEESPKLVNRIERDLNTRWDQQPDVYVDMNRPIRPASVERQSENPTKIRERLIYPIVDPNRYNGQKNDIERNTEGFIYGDSTLSAPQINGVDPRSAQLAMPVQWIYLLRDGSTGTLDEEGKFTPMDKSGGQPSITNPIVSRIAWWTDDESCKINVNTASVPIPWDNPRTSSAECLWYAQHQPVSGECQHYPGHPAQTDLCAVLFPGFRYSPDTGVMPVGRMRQLPLDRAKLIWNITPFITEEGGSNGGVDVVKPLTASPVKIDTDDHLFATVEELYFKARRADKNLDRPRGSVAPDDVSGDFLKRLEGSQFFLTTRSSGPEMTVYGTPRVCMFPMNEQVVAEVGKPSGAVNPNVGAFEVTMATNSTIGAAAGRLGKAFYFQRSTNAESRHNAFYNNSGGRNAQIFKYLKKLTVAPPPGYPELSQDFDTFSEKYPGPNGINGNIGPNKAQADFDSSDRTQIVLSMLDLLRSSNMAPGYLASGRSYDNGGGQVAGICGCNTIRPSDVQAGHTAALLINPSTPTVYTPKGSGRTYGPAEILLVAHVAAIKREGQGTQGATNLRPVNPGMARRWNEAKTASLVQLGVLVNSFTPRQGWAPIFAESGVNISNHLAASSSDPRTAANGTNEAPFFCANNTPSDPTARPEEPFYFGQTVDGRSPTPTGADPPVPIPQGFIPWGGISGARVSASQSVAAFDPFVFEGTGAGSTARIRLQLKWNPGKILRVFMYDGVPANYNTIQAVEIEPKVDDQLEFIDVAFTGKTLDQVVSGSLAAPAAEFPPRDLAALSFVVPHGDYRLTSIPLQVERGVFVMHGDYRHSLVEPTIQGSVTGYVPGRGASLSADPLLTLSGGKPINPENAPHFANVKKASLCRDELGTNPAPGVVQVASSRPGGSEADIFKLRFAHGRRDGQYRGPQYKPFSAANKIPNRGSSDPLETGDFDTGMGLCPDGAYMNQPDDGDARDANQPYYRTLNRTAKVNPATFSPNRVLRSPVDFGSIPSGIQARVPWQTLRFRPDPGMYNAQNQIRTVNDQPRIPDGTNHYFPFSNYCGPKDHLLLDMWWMPIVEPWAISEGFATKGQINLNQQIFPFTYIQRTTALHALLRGERMMAIPDQEADQYKSGANFPNPDVYRHWIDAKETIRQITEFRWKGQDLEGMTIPFNAFRSASEICELWLVPDTAGGAGTTPTLSTISRQFWTQHRLTGDNMRERPYSNIYPRLTVRSNVFRVHMIAQTLKKASTNKPETFKSVSEEGSDPDLVTAEWRGSALIERVLNPNEPALQNFDYAPGDQERVYEGMDVKWPPKLDNYYTYRVTEVKQFTQ